MVRTETFDMQRDITFFTWHTYFSRYKVYIDGNLITLSWANGAIRRTLDRNLQLADFDVSLLTEEQCYV